MRKLITLVVIVFSVASVSAQKGSMYIGTSGIDLGGEQLSQAGLPNLNPMTGFTTVSFGDEKMSMYGLAPEFGYFVADNMAVGAGLFFKGISMDDGDDKASLSIFGINPYLRYYCLNKGNFKAYVQAGLTYATISGDMINDMTMSLFDISVMPGISYNLTEKFAINATLGSLGYGNLSIKDVDDSFSTFGLDLNLTSLKFGFTLSF